MRKNEPSASQSFFSSYAGQTWGVILTFVTIFLIVALSGCPKPTLTRVPSYEEARQQALKEAPFILEPVEERNGLKCKDKAIPLKKDDAKGIPFTGNLITNDKAECMIAIAAERDRVRKELSTVRLQMRTREIINDAAIQRLVEEAKPSWWQLHSWKILAPALIAVGGALVLGVLYAVTGGKSVTVNTVLLPNR